MKEPVLVVDKIVVQTVHPETGEIIGFKLECKMVLYDNSLVLVGVGENGEVQRLLFKTPSGVAH